MPCYEPSGCEFDLAYEKDTNKNLTKLLTVACNMLESEGRLHLIDSHGELSHWWKLHKTQETLTIEKERRRALAEQLLNKPFKDLTSEDKKLLKEFGYF